MNFWHSRHSSQIKLSSQELHQISQKINQDYAPIVATQASELVLLPVDPYHLYAYWNLAEKQAGSKQNNDDGNHLTLRIFWRPDESHEVNKTKLWFDVAINSQNQQKIRLPVDETAYSAAIGRCIQDEGFVASAYSNIIHVPRGRMAPEQSRREKIVAEENIDFENREESESVREIDSSDSEEKTVDSISQYYDEALIDLKIKKTMFEKGIEKDIDNLLNPYRVTEEESYHGISIASNQGSIEYNASSQVNIEFNTSSQGNRK